MRIRLVCFAFSLICAFSLPIAAADEKWKVETLLGDLSAPNGLAIQPGTEDIFISESGAGKVIVVSPAKPDAYTVAIEGFPRSENPKNDNTAVRSGVAGLGFLDEQVLAVAFSRANQKPALGVYQLREEKDAKPLHFEAAKQILGSAEAGAQNQNASAEASLGSYFAVAVSPFSPPALFLTNPGSNRGWLFKADIRMHSTLEELKPFMATKVTPLAIAVNRRGILVVATSAEHGKAAETTLSFYNTKTGGVIASFTAPLGDILSLAYSPESGRLYAASSFRAKPAADAGVYRLDATTIENRAGMTALRIAAIDRPTVLAFAMGNSLYATALGAAGTEAKPNPSAKGSLIRITGDL